MAFELIWKGLSNNMHKYIHGIFWRQTFFPDVTVSVHDFCVPAHIILQEIPIQIDFKRIGVCQHNGCRCLAPTWRQGISNHHVNFTCYDRHHYILLLLLYHVAVNKHSCLERGTPFRVCVHPSFIAFVNFTLLARQLVTKFAPSMHLGILSVGNENRDHWPWLSRSFWPF